MELFDFLAAKSDAFALQIELLAIALALIALAPNKELLPSRFLRRLPILAAIGIGVVVVVWASRVFLNPIPIYFEDAVINYARGVGLSYQGDHAGAVAAFDQTLMREPEYTNALYRRGNAHFALKNYDAAAADYQAAWDAGREELNVLLAEIQQIISQDGGVIIPYLMPILSATRDNVHGFTPNLFIFSQFVWLDPQS